MASADLHILGPLSAEHAEVLTEDARALLVDLAREFRPRIQALLAARVEQQARFDQGELPQFLPETADIRDGDWRVADIPSDLQRRCVEITGPVDRKMIINALNSGADLFMADFEDSSAPTWTNMLDGQVNLRDAIRREITFHDARKNKDYALNEKVATLLVRPRGLHLWEKHVHVDGEPVPAGLFDFGLYMLHNARELLARGAGPYFYLPKLQHHLEARLWNDVFNFTQQRLDVPQGSIRATVLIETLPAAFQMNEILHELRDHSAGLNCGRWDYIFSFIKTLRAHDKFVLPDRALVGMTQPFMRAYTQLVIKTCHRRGIHAMGGMAAQIPIKNDPEANEIAMAKVRADKEREIADGHDGSWVAHPGLVPMARELFGAALEGDNQLHVMREDVSVSASDLVEVPMGERTEAGLRHNIRVGIRYLAAWLGGNGCVPLDNLMEDAATAEISRAQVWQWVRHAVVLSNGQQVTAQLVRNLVDDEMTTLRAAPDAPDALDRARTLFEEMSTADELADFLTLAGYEQLLTLN